MKPLEYIIDIVIAVIILFLFPVLYFGQKQDALTRTVISTKTKEIVDEVRSKGYITREMYEGYLEELSDTGLLYHISMKQRQLMNEPEYRLRTPEEVIEEQNTAYTGSNIYTYHPITTDAPVVVEPVRNGSLNTETNASVLASAINTPASSSHVHTDACYNGIKHVHSGNASSGGGCYGNYSTHTHNSSCYKTSYCSGTWDGAWSIYYRIDHICTNCGANEGATLNVNVPKTLTCYRCDTTYTSYPYETGRGNWYGDCTSCPAGIASTLDMQGVTHGTITDLICNKTGEYLLNCNKIANAYYDGVVQVFPVCSQQITSISPTHSLQTVYVNDQLITTVTASYVDGSTKTVIGTTTFSTATPVQNTTVVISYNTTIGGITTTKTCTITVTVIPRSKICINGHTYNLNVDSSDPMCPYCRAWLKSLEIEIPSSDSITIFKGTSLSENGVTLLATYLDGHKEHLDTEYVDNLDKNYVGTQNVTLSYKGHNVNLIVITKRNLKRCPICGRYYELYPDLSDPGCPYCQSKTPIFTGNILNYNDEKYSEDILKELYEGSGTYYFSRKDYFLISMENKSRSFGEGILSAIYLGLAENTIQTSYGGYIREEGQ